MSELVELSIARPLNPPVTLSLVPEHLPPAVRQAFEAVTDAVADKVRIERDLATAHTDDKARLEEAATAATARAVEAVNTYSATATASTSAIADSARAAYDQALEDATAHIRAAQNKLIEARRAAALHSSVRPGRAPSRLDTAAAASNPVMMRLAVCGGHLGETISDLPVSINTV